VVLAASDYKAQLLAQQHIMLAAVRVVALLAAAQVD
jgi:hypothetical protein